MKVLLLLEENWIFVEMMCGRFLPLAPLISISVSFSDGTADVDDGTVPVDAVEPAPVAALLVKRLLRNPVYDRPVGAVVSSVCRMVNGSSKHSISGLYNLNCTSRFL